MASIRIQDLVKRFENGVEAVQGVTLEVADGEFVVLVGPSGCGKSTTLRMVAGLEEASAGDIFIGGKRVNDVEPGKRDIAMVFQNYALYPHMTVRQNMSFGLKMRHVSKAEIQQRVNDAAAILSIESLLERRPRELSGGQRQRVAVGRAIVRKPAAYLFDEPLSNLDAKLRLQMRKELAQIHQQLKTTTLYVTHDQVEAMTLGQRIVVMNEGIIQQVATPMKLYQEPANRFVATFIGSPAMNILPGKILENGQQFQTRNSRTTYPIRMPANQAGPASPALLGFRPEHLTLDASHPQIGAIEVDLVERLGDESLVYFKLEDQNCTARLPGNAACQQGERLSLHLPKDKWHLFSAQSPHEVVSRGCSAGK
ncbi:MAG: sn-glycerol-3-phosphate ABC transporter ATP-binding protein UgpC [Pirellulaceae bacterium]|nr:sn-glycerol-3-phosphate ABC transporter ATP-binding protein UgpC [Pirellulaceae bacterium]